MNASEFFADLLMLLHALYSLFVLGGLVLILAGAALGWQWTGRRWFRVTHLVMAVFVAVRVWIGLPCPFSTGEDRLRFHNSSSCLLGMKIHDALHRLAFRGQDRQRFASSTTAFAAVVVIAFVVTKRTAEQFHTVPQPSTPAMEASHG